MEITEQRMGAIHVITVAGQLDMGSVNGFQELALSRIDPTLKYLVLDFTRLTYISSIGLRCIVLLAKKLKENFGELAFVGLTKQVRDVFATAGYDRLFTLHATPDAALAVIKAKVAGSLGGSAGK